LQDNWNPILIALVAVAAGTAVGFLNGILITWLRIPDIIATLGTSNIWRAAVFGMLGGQWLTGLPDVYSALTSERILGAPVSAFVLLVFYAGFWYLLVHTPFGRRLYAVGNSPEAATLAGIDAKRIRIFTYSILGSLVGFASLLYVGRLASVEITVGIALPINAIAAVIIGGTAITGGRGSIIGTLAGVFFMAIMRNGIVLLGIPSLWERAVVGTLIIVSVTADVVYELRLQRRRRQEKAARRGKQQAPRDLDASPSPILGG
jgi:ribose transport system permease protein/AI-2 transport system permease protein